jgi:hypothetical protein
MAEETAPKVQCSCCGAEISAEHWLCPVCGKYRSSPLLASGRSSSVDIGWKGCLSATLTIALSGTVLVSLFLTPYFVSEYGLLKRLHITLKPVSVIAVGVIALVACLGIAFIFYLSKTRK